jgi:hypothetical protein
MQDAGGQRKLLRNVKEPYAGRAFKTMCELCNKSPQLYNILPYIKPHLYSQLNRSFWEKGYLFIRLNTKKKNMK